MGTHSLVDRDTLIMIARAFVIALLFVLCLSVFFHGFATSNSNSQTPAMACCITDGHTSLDAHHMASIVTRGFESLALFFAVIGVLFLGLHFNGVAVSQRGANYIRSMRDRYGGFRALNYWQNLFSQGLLHSRDSFFAV